MNKIPFVIALLAVVVANVEPVSAYKPGEYPGDPKIQPWNVKRWEKACEYMNKGNELSKKEKTQLDVSKTCDAYRGAKLLYPWDFRFEVNDALHYSTAKKPNRRLIEILLQRAILLCPSEWSNWNALANVYYKRGQLHEAKPLLIQALALNPPEGIAGKLKANIAQIDAELIAGKTSGFGRFKQQVEPKLWYQPETPLAVSVATPED